MQDTPAAVMRTLAICRRCVEVYPSSRACPRCEGDLEAARQMHSLRRYHDGLLAASAQEELLAPRLGDPRRARGALGYALAGYAAATLVIVLGAALYL